MNNNQKTVRDSSTRTWSKYNDALVRRGSLTLWFNEAAIDQWYESSKAEEKRQRGSQRIYSDSAIEVMVTLQAIFHLGLRQTEGLIGSIVELMEIELDVPDYSTLSRRRRSLQITLPRCRRNEPFEVVVDATGVKIYGDGEWMRHLYKPSTNRRWRKLHIAIDPETLQILAPTVSSNDQTDAEQFESLLEQIPEQIAEVIADGAYDKRHCYQTLIDRDVGAVIPPQKRAKIWKHGNCRGARHPRDENLREIRRRSRQAWKCAHEYGRRSLVETTFSRLKLIFGGHLRSRSFEAQAVELLARCRMLNQLLELGRPPTVAA